MLPLRRQHVLIVETVEPGSELAGEPETVTEVAQVYGAIMPLSGNEYLRAQQLEATVSHVIRTEFMQTAHPRMRLRHGERVFNVESVVNVAERNRELEWRCTEAT